MNTHHASEGVNYAAVVMYIDLYMCLTTVLGSYRVNSHVVHLLAMSVLP